MTEKNPAAVPHVVPPQPEGSEVDQRLDEIRERAADFLRTPKDDVRYLLAKLDALLEQRDEWIAERQAVLPPVAGLIAQWRNTAADLQEKAERLDRLREPERACKLQARADQLESDAYELAALVRVGAPAPPVDEK